MATFIVDTLTDVVNAGDGLTSLREALVLAQSNGGADTITFDAALSGQTVSLSSRLTIVNGENVTIDGDLNNDGIGDITISGGNTTNHFSVNNGAYATLDGLALIDGNQTGSNGSNSYSGSGGPSGFATGSILNAGNLTLENVVFSGNDAVGGNGGNGGTGSYGSYTFRGAGRPGRDGGSASDGAVAAADILNTASGIVAFNDVVFDTISTGSAIGGNGGNGGNGGRGGYGVSYFDFGSSTTLHYRGGDGGNGGDGGDGGTAGRIVNYGSITSADPTIGGTYNATDGIGGSYGTGGTGGNASGGGQPNGNVGSDGTAGSAATTAAFLVNLGAGTDSLSLTATTFNVFALDPIQDEGVPGNTTFRFQVNRLGDTSGTGSVQLAIAGSGANPADADDFAFGNLPAPQSVDFLAGETSKTVTITVAGDNVAEADEEFTATISTPVGGALGATTTATSVISNDDTSISITALDAVRNEQDTGLSGFSFTVTRSGLATGQTDFGFGVTGSGANPADAADFIGSLPFGNGSFGIGETSKTIFIPVAGDILVENDEEFTVFLLGATGGASITQSTATGTIINEDTGQNFIGTPIVDNFVGTAAGFDSVSYENSTAVIIDLATPANNFGDSVGDTFTDIDRIVGSSQNDTLRGGAGDDTLDGGLGNDTLDGAGGNDTASYASSTTAVDVSLIITGPQATGAGTDTLISIENLTGGSGDDTLQGAAGANGDNILDGGDGDDELYGLGGNDTLLGGNDDDYIIAGAGNDIVDGGDGDDIIHGGNDNDTITGGVGKDILYGESGTDIFDYNDVAESGLVYADRDIIRDFSQADGDQIDLSGIDADTSSSGSDEAFTFLGTFASTIAAIPFTNTAGELFAVNTAGGQTVLWGDVDGDGVQDFTLVIDDTVALTDSDFIL